MVEMANDTPTLTLPAHGVREPALPVSGEILTSHVRSIDTLARPISYAGAGVPAATLDEVRSKLAALIGL